MNRGDILALPAIRDSDWIDFHVLHVLECRCVANLNLRHLVVGCDFDIRANKELGVYIGCHGNVLSIRVFGISIRSRDVRFNDWRFLVLMINNDMGVQVYVVWLNGGRLYRDMSGNFICSFRMSYVDSVVYMHIFGVVLMHVNDWVNSISWDIYWVAKCWVNIWGTVNWSCNVTSWIAGEWSLNNIISSHCVVHNNVLVVNIGCRNLNLRIDVNHCRCNIILFNFNVRVDNMSFEHFMSLVRGSYGNCNFSGSFLLCMHMRHSCNRL